MLLATRTAKGMLIFPELRWLRGEVAKILSLYDKRDTRSFAHLEANFPDTRRTRDQAVRT